MRNFLKAGILSGALGLMIASPASGAVTVGVALPAAPNNNLLCSATCTIANASPGSAAVPTGGFTAPGPGVIVRWRIHTSAAKQEAGPVDAVFRVLAGNHGAGSSAPVVLPDVDGVQEFPVPASNAP